MCVYRTWVYVCLYRCLCVCVCTCACVRARVCVYVRACVRACVRASSVLLVVLRINSDGGGGVRGGQDVVVVEVFLYVHRHRRLIRDGRAQDVHLDFHTAPDL